MRNKAIALVIVTLAMFGMASLPFVSAQNQTAKGLVEGMLQDVLSSEGRRVLVDGVSIALDGDVTATRIQVQDDAGTWLEMQDFALDWQPLSLLSDSLKINSLSVGRLNVQRAPNAAVTDDAAAPNTPTDLESLKDAVISEVSIAKLELSKELADETFVLKVDGSGQVKQSPPEVSFKLNAERINGGDSRLVANMLLDPASRLLKLDLKLKEGKDGLIVNLLDIANEPSVDLDLTAEGTIDQWTGKFGLRLDGSTAAQGSARMNSDTAGKRLSLDAEGEIGRLVSKQLAGWLGGSTQLVGSILFEKDKDRAQVQRIRVGNKTVQLRASGPVDWSGDTSNLAIEFRSDAAHPLLISDQSPALGRVEVKGLNGDLNITGSMTEPVWRFKGSAGGMSSDLAVLDQLNIALNGSGIDLETVGTEVNGSISAEVSRGKSNAMPAAVLGPFRARFTVQTDQPGRLVISETTATAGKARAALNGNLTPATGAFDIGFNAAAKSPETGYGLLDGLLSGDAGLSGRLAGNGKGQFNLTNWKAKSEALAFTLEGSVADTVDLTLTGQLKDLGQLHDEASGGARLEAKVSGDRSAPLLNLTASGDSITLVGAALNEAELKANLKLSETDPSGQLNFAAKLQDQPVTARALVSTTAEGTRELTELSLVAGSARLDGTYRMPIAGAPSGAFKLVAPDLSDVGPLLLTQLRGSLNADIELTGAGDRSDLKAAFNGEDIASDGFAAKKVVGSAQVADVFNRPKVAGNATLQQARMGDLVFDAVTATATSKGDEGYAVKLDVDGDDLSARALADVSLGEDQTVVVVSKFSGKAQSIAFAISNPFTITRGSSGEVAMKDAALRIGKGRIKMDGKVLPELDAKIAFASVPLSPFELLSGVRGLSGTVSGRAAVQGALDNPLASFELKGQSLRADDLRAQGLSALQVGAVGGLKNRRVTLRGTANAGADLSVSAQGQVDLSRAEPTFDIRAKGQAGTRLVAGRLADAGVRFVGAVGFDMRLRGTPDKPDVQGTVSLKNVTVGDQDGRFVVSRATGRIELAGSSVRIVSFQGRMGKSGSLVASGSVGLEGANPANIVVRIQNGVYADGTLVTARYDANLRLVGPLATSPLLQGDIILKKTKVTLSEVPPTALRPLDVRHRKAPAKVRRQAQKIKARGGSGNSDIRLDLRITAKESIAVSGRGITALLGGSLNLSGTPSALIAQGSFRLRRGTLKLLGQRLEFESGRLDFDRDLDPRLNLVAVSRTSDATIRLLIAGRASAPEISVTSSPELPQEEALARLVFDRELLQLSPLQIAQLAASIATLSGGSDSSILGDLQDTLGVDWLEITETPSGETAVGVGKQLNERLSVGVEQSTKSNTSRVIIDLGITKSLKLRGAAGTDGSSRAGVFFEKDY